MTTEEWRTVDCAPAYEVSSLGRVRRAKDGHTTKAGRILRSARSGGYRRLTLIDPSGRRISANIHRLVCIAFHGEPQPPKIQAAHLNGDPADNRAENLAWATPKENTGHMYQHGTMRFGEKTKRNKLTESQVLAIRERRLSTRAAYIAAASEFGVCSETIARVARGEMWQHLPQTRTNIVRAIGVRK